MDWEEKYFEKLEMDIRELREQIQGMEDRFEEKLKRDMVEIVEKLQQLEKVMEGKIDQAVTNIMGITKSRHEDYLAVNKRLDNLAQRIDRTVSWVMGTFLAVAGLVLTVIFA